jgi:hypothetical protein
MLMVLIMRYFVTEMNVREKRGDVQITPIRIVRVKIKQNLPIYLYQCYLH